MGLFKRIKELEKNINDLRLDNEKLHRILNFYIPGKITWVRNSECAIFHQDKDESSYIYKDGREYRIKALSLWCPKIKETKISNILIIKDINREYVVDLNDCSFKLIGLEYCDLE